MNAPQPGRSLRDLERQKREVSAFLRATVSPDEAEAMASAGYRDTPCGACGKSDCRYCDADPREQVRTGSHRGHRPSGDPRFVGVVINRVGAFPSHMFVGVPSALGRIDPDERLVLLLELGQGLCQERVARQLKISVRSVPRVRERGLEMVARIVWDDEGAARFEVA